MESEERDCKTPADARNGSQQGLLSRSTSEEDQIDAKSHDTRVRKNETELDRLASAPRHVSQLESSSVAHGKRDQIFSRYFALDGSKLEF